MTNENEKIGLLIGPNGLRAIDVQILGEAFGVNQTWSSELMTEPIIGIPEDFVPSLKGTTLVGFKHSTRVVVKPHDGFTPDNWEGLLRLTKEMNLQRLIIIKDPNIKINIGASCYHDGPNPVGLYIGDF